MNFATKLEGIKDDTQRLAATYEIKKRNKLTRLAKEKPTKTKRHRSKKSDRIKKESNVNSVVNVSNVTLSEGEMSLLSRGLSFCPKPSRIDQFQLRDDIKRFSRRLRLREFFYDPEEINEDLINPFKPKSNWTPEINREPALEAYIKSVREDIYRILDRGHPRRSNDNITSLEIKAL